MKIDLVVCAHIFNKKDEVLLIHHKSLKKWLPVGGHIEKNETPDDAIIREIKEEVDLEVIILNHNSIHLGGNTKQELATPFYVNVHSVGNHDHCCFYYICRTKNSKKVRINKESKDFKWFSQKDLDMKIVPVDVRFQAREAYKLYKICSGIKK